MHKKNPREHRLSPRKMIRLCESCDAHDDPVIWATPTEIPPGKDPMPIYRSCPECGNEVVRQVPRFAIRLRRHLKRDELALYTDLEWVVVKAATCSTYARRVSVRD